MSRAATKMEHDKPLIENASKKMDFVKERRDHEDGAVSREAPGTCRS